MKLPETDLHIGHHIIMEYSTDGILILDKSGNIAAVNKKVSQIFEYDRQELINKSTLPGKSKKIDLKNLLLSPDYDFDHSIITKSGNLVYVNIKSVQIEENTLLIIRDQTEKRKLERIHAESRKLLEKRTREMKCLTKISEYTWDENTDLEHLLFLITNTIPMGFDDPLDLRALITIRDDQFASDNVVELKDWLEAPISVNNQEIGDIKVFYRSQQPIKDIGSFYLEEEVLLNNVADRIGKLIERRENWARIKEQEEKLIETEKLKVVSQMVGAIAHDFNNMLTTIMGFTELSLHNLDKIDTVDRYLNLIMNAAEKGSNLTNQLLSFGKQNKVKEKLFNFDTLMKDINPIIETMLPGSIELNTEIDSKYEIKADFNIIERIVINLILNAKDAITGPGSILIQCRDTVITNHPHLDPGEYVQFKVSDDGCGMSEEVKSKIFNPFFTTKTHGTGLGLPSVKSTLDELNGYIDLESELNIGTKVSIYIPVSTEKLTDEKHKEDMSMMKESSINGLNIVIIDDEINVANVLENALTNDNIVQTFNDPLEAKDWVKDNIDNLDLIITDIIMPDMNGIELIDSIKKYAGWMPQILFISAYTGDLMMENIEIESYFLRKPFTITKLKNKINEIFQS